MISPEDGDPAAQAAAEIGYLTARRAEDYLGCVKELISMTVWLVVTGPGQQVAVAQRGNDTLVCAYTSPRLMRWPDVGPDALLARQFLELVEGWPYGERGLVINLDDDSEFRMPRDVLPKVLQVRQNMRAQQGAADAGAGGGRAPAGRPAAERQDVLDALDENWGAPPVVAPIEPPAQIGEFRFAAMAEGFDDEGRPYVSAEWPRVTDFQEKRRIRAYLEAGEVLQVAPERLTDMYRPSRGEIVPASTRTDGTWIWLDAVAYYLDEYDIGPEPEFYTHIVQQYYRCPPLTREEAERAGSALEERQRIASRLYAEWREQNTHPSVQFHPSPGVPESDLLEIERKIGQPLPKDYRDWLKAQDGGVLVGGGASTADVPLYIKGLLSAALDEDGTSEIVYYWNSAALQVTTRDYLPVEYSAAGYLLLKLSDPDRGSVWWLSASDMGWDYEDEYEEAGYSSEQEYICAEMLQRVASSFKELLAKLRPYE